MQTKLTLPLVMISVLAAIAFGWQWVRENQRTYNLTMTTGGKDGEYHAFATALAEVVTKHEPQIKFQSSKVRVPRKIWNGWAGVRWNWRSSKVILLFKPSARAVAYLFPEVFHLIALENSGIAGVADLRGKRIALMPEGS
ncbi:MAG: C4-dicarboxylate ABC transporter substrate-binding protein, partial [Leptolyngbyaceae cyanobacterium SM1_4_3]|nr:C4-dicarboxylate ABC transporter substrate-binding protein [Leptolyngbyaceae cyanobacterium SM1_4_3]